MSHKHVKFINTTVLNTVAMTEDIDAQIKELQERKKAQNRVNAKSNLIKIAGNKNVTDEQLLKACFTFIGTHRLNSPRKPKEVSPVQ